MGVNDMKYTVATLTLCGDEGYPCYSNIEDIEAVSEKQAIFFYEKKHGISYYESMKCNGRQGVIYDPSDGGDYYEQIHNAP